MTEPTPDPVPDPTVPPAPSRRRRAPEVTRGQVVAYKVPDPLGEGYLEGLAVVARGAGPDGGTVAIVPVANHHLEVDPDALTPVETLEG